MIISDRFDALDHQKKSFEKSHFSDQGSPLTLKIRQVPSATGICPPRNRLALSSEHKLRIIKLYLIPENYHN